MKASTLREMDDPFSHASPNQYKLDVVDLNYVSSSESLGVYNYKPPRKWKRGILINLGTFAAKWVRAAFSNALAPSWRTLDPNGVLVGVWSLNQQRALEPILRSMPNISVMSLHRDIQGPQFPESRAYPASLPFLPQLIRMYAASAGYQRIGFEHDFDRYLLTYGYFQTAVRVMRELRPKLVLVANDHTMETRTLEHAANRLGITTAYVQHASVTKGFPPLEFSLAFLDGRDAAEKYDVPGGNNPRVFLTGIPKADEARKLVRSRISLQRVGVCVNVLDPMPAVINFVEELTARSPQTEVVLRPHPSDQRPWMTALPEVEHSDAQTEPSFEFLNRVDGIVTGPSNIALEAALVGVGTVFVDFGNLGLDPYDFLQRGLCRKVESASEALEAIDPAQGPTLREAVLRDYCATVGTEYDGRSSELVRELITEELQGGINMNRWRRAEGFRHILVYELKN